MVIGLLLNGSGIHQAAWRRPGSRIEDAYSLPFYRDAAAAAERAKIHLLFLADSPIHSQALFPVRPLRYLEAITLAGALAASTDRIGLVATASTTFTEPYNIVRQLNSLDHLSGGRAGWNMVTSYGGASNFSRAEILDHSMRHRRAHEYADLVCRLWASWDADAVVLDRTAGVYGDPAKVHQVSYDGQVFQVDAMLNMPPGPQGRPVIAQAGTSESGKNLAARYADVVYAVSPTLPEAQEYYRDLKSRTVAAGRSPEDIKILPGVSPVIGESEAEARAMNRELNDLIDFGIGFQQLQELLPGVDLAAYDLDEAPPAEAFPDVSTVQVMQSRYEVYRYMAVEERRTIRQMIEFNCTAGGHHSPVGAVEQVADELEHRFRNGGGDGYNISALYMPEGINRITDMLVPELQRRGLFRTEYADGTLRDNLGLSPVAVPR
ncbi:NtaA/DmoA family FMN-dependent monooxygenase [Nakamurella leprariae]|uniref:NtaA/DmoA family FMN-dependent monooxygenase n=1 Tax=Nakamurella leprariae TaxID=2803911 RepID=A0A938YIU1_9ACTN|nr:NtaA/DmoA family FMN-dependent monooxygenase [Nakamurella leprariae]MBM9468575.1 NtaA/DmoA family FMN-dependent monooxygenase [Nakamurella leprariae]